MKGRHVFLSIGRFFKKNVFYIVLGLCVVGVGIGITFACIEGTKGNSNNVIEKPDDSNNQTSNSGGDVTDPVDKEIVFITPVENGNVLKSYVSSSVVFNSTLNRFSKHLAIDYTGAEGASVLAVYNGTIESVETSLLEGVTITINHGNGLKTVYNSLLDDGGMTAGKSVKKGDKIGVISTTNRQEYKDGAHLHFEVYENDVNVDPTKYLTTEEK